MTLFPRRAVLAAVAVGFAAMLAPAADSTPTKRLLLVTDSGGFVHDSVGVAEEILKEIGPKHGFAVTAHRFTREPDAKVLEKYSEAFRARTGLTVTAENCGRVNAETLKNFDVVLFFTTGNPLNKEEVADLAAWVKAGGALAGTHCATDTLYARKETPWNAVYGDMIGGYFDGHPWHQKVKLKVEDPKHPAAAGFEPGAEIADEIYQFRAEPYSREKLRIILSIDNSSVDVNKKDVRRADKDFAVAWVQNYGKGKVFYTSLGHRKEVWKDPRFQAHLIGGLQWATGQLPGDATPSGKAAANP
ncbi:MAG: ThuA domain-containing protein [Fimbriiglobus sp.]